MDIIEKNILKIQNWYRNTVKLKLHIISRINFDIDNLYHLIFSTMDRIQNNFINGIFSQINITGNFFTTAKLTDS